MRKDHSSLLGAGKLMDKKLSFLPGEAARYGTEIVKDGGRGGSGGEQIMAIL